jgi:fructosamine-3-kinase
MPFDTTEISRGCATELLRAFTEKDLTVTGIRRLHGGMVNSVLELATDGDPKLVVAKLCAEPGQGGFEWEYRVLKWYRQNTAFPVPEPYGFDLSGKVFPGSCLMMERLPGDNLGQVRLGVAGRMAVERQMARILVDLHGHRREAYGSALEPSEGGSARWLDRFGPRIRSEFEAAADRLSPQARRAIEQTLERLEDWLPEFGDPTLVHGDLWATNIIVSPDGPEGPAISGFVDGGAEYAEVEYELAYLLVFHTVGSAFFAEYSRLRPLREGFQTRCRIYWLNTMMLHVRYFGDAHYVQACERLAEEVGRLGPPAA